MKKFTIVLLATLMSSPVFSQIGWVSTFESIPLSKADTFWNGQDLSNGFLNGQAFYKTAYDTAWKSWSGVAVSNMTDSTTKGYGNQFSAIKASGVNYTNQYAVVNQTTTIVLTEKQTINGCYVTNATYPALSMRDGDGFAKKFGGKDGNDKDYFRIIATGHSGTASKEAIFYLADFTNDDNSKDYIVMDWEYFNLSALGEVDSITFSFESSDTGQFGMNTPAYFCLDNFNATSELTSPDWDNDFSNLIPLDSFENGANYEGGFALNNLFFVNSYNKAWKSWDGWAISSTSDTQTASYTNQYSVITGKAYAGNGYIVGYQKAEILFPYSSNEIDLSNKTMSFTAVVNNSTYAYKTMQDGNSFAKKFGGASGTDKDYLVLKVSGTNYHGQALDTLTHYLADFRSDNNADDFIQKDWQVINLKDIMRPQMSSLSFWVEGSDTGQFGLNTPGYFCLDFIFPNTVGIEETKEVTWNLYPNPCNNNIYVDIDAPIKSLIVYDLSGKPVSTAKGSRNMNVSQLANGMYILQVNTTAGKVTKRFIKQ